jgi:hypothetical protein
VEKKEVDDHILPNYSAQEHYRWEAHLHGVEIQKRLKGEVLTYEERKAIVDDFVRKHPRPSGDIVHCKACERAHQLDVQEGKETYLSDKARRDLMQSLGLRIGSKRPYQNSKANEGLKRL